MRNILKEEDIAPGPDRKSEVWTDFLNRHGETLWASDFFSVRTVTSSGVRKMYMLVSLCVKTREAYVTEATLHPNSAWVSEETTRFLHSMKGRDKPPKYILHDRDAKYTDEFVKSAKASGAKAVALPEGATSARTRLADSCRGDSHLGACAQPISRVGLSNFSNLTAYQDCSGEFDLSSVLCALKHLRFPQGFSPRSPNDGRLGRFMSLGCSP